MPYVKNIARDNEGKSVPFRARFNGERIAWGPGEEVPLVESAAAFFCRRFPEQLRRLDAPSGDPDKATVKFKAGPLFRSRPLVLKYDGDAYRLKDGDVMTLEHKALKHLREKARKQGCDFEVVASGVLQTAKAVLVDDEFSALREFNKYAKLDLGLGDTADITTDGALGLAKLCYDQDPTGTLEKLAELSLNAIRDRLVDDVGAADAPSLVEQEDQAREAALREAAEAPKKSKRKKAKFAASPEEEETDAIDSFAASLMEGLDDGGSSTD